MAKKKNKTRKDGLIAVQIYTGRDENGSRKYKTVYGKTQQEVNGKADELRAAMRKGLDINAERDTFAEWAGRWLKIKTPEVSRSQATTYKTRIEYINSLIGDRALTKVKSIDLQEIISSLAENNPNTNAPASKRLLEITKSTLSQVFALAIENRVLDYNPAMSVKLPKNAPEQKRRALTNAEQQWIMNTPHRAQSAAMIMMFSGLRRGEVIPLTWSDVDLENRTITVTRTVEKTSNTFIIKDGA
jgi:integrase